MKGMGVGMRVPSLWYRDVGTQLVLLWVVKVELRFFVFNETLEKTMQYLTLVPAYGRDYKSKKSLLEDWKAGKDFLIASVMSPWYGKYVSSGDAPALKAEGVEQLTIHYKASTRVCVIKI